MKILTSSWKALDSLCFVDQRRKIKSTGNVASLQLKRIYLLPVIALSLYTIL